MSKVTVAVTNTGDGTGSAFVEAVRGSGSVEVVVFGPRTRSESESQPARRFEGSIDSAEGLNWLLSDQDPEFLLVAKAGEQITPGPDALGRLVRVAEDTGAGLVYSDFRDGDAGASTDHGLIDYQFGSIRDTFDFGSLTLFSARAIREAITRHGAIPPEIRFGSLYDLRLKLSLDSKIVRIPEPLYTRVPVDRRASGDKQFDYVDPRQRDYQIEMEDIATAHLKRIGAHLPATFRPVPEASPGARGAPRRPRHKPPRQPPCETASEPSRTLSPAPCRRRQASHSTSS
jgi:hypothetical protein